MREVRGEVRGLPRPTVDTIGRGARRSTAAACAAAPSNSAASARLSASSASCTDAEGLVPPPPPPPPMRCTSADSSERSEGCSHRSPGGAPRRTGERSACADTACSVGLGFGLGLGGAAQD